MRNEKQMKKDEQVRTEVVANEIRKTGTICNSNFPLKSYKRLREHAIHASIPLNLPEFETISSCCIRFSRDQK
jgi:hypothetical protein